jgi:hypothetical protein
LELIVLLIFFLTSFFTQRRRWIAVSEMLRLEEKLEETFGVLVLSTSLVLPPLWL